MSIRRALQSDELAVIALWLACELVMSYNDRSDDFHFAVCGACSDVLINENKACQIDGSVMVGHDGHRGWLYYVAIAPQARGFGLGRTMVQVAEQWLSQRGVVKAQLLIPGNEYRSGRVLRAFGL